MFLQKQKKYQDYFKDSVSNERIVNIGWRSIDLNTNSQEREYNKFLLFCHDINQAPLYKKIINTWNNEERLQCDGDNCLVTLHIVNFNLTQMKETDITRCSICN